MISKKVLSIIVCPVCKGQLKEEKSHIYCAKCDRKYELTENIPNLLVKKDDRSDTASSRTSEFKSGLRNSRIFKALKYIFGADFVPYDPLKRYDDLFFGVTRRGGLVLNLGSGSTKYQDGVINVDIELFPNVDIVADGCQLLFADGTFDAVISEAVIEHVRYPGKFINESKRVIRKGGAAFIIAPFVHPFHSYPSDFQRYSIEGLKALFEEFQEVECGVYRGPNVAFVNFFSDYLSILLCFNIIPIRMFFKYLFTLILFPVKFLDIFFNNHKNGHLLAHCVFYIGKKR